VVSGKFNNVRWLTNTSYRPSDNAKVTDSTPATVQSTAYFGNSQTVWDDGFNTNFATTWHFVRGDNVTRGSTGDDRFTVDGDTNDASKCPLDGDGPLSSGILASTTLVTTADKIALMGAARIGDGADSTINASGINDADTINLFIDASGRKKFAKVGDFTVESFTDGPSATRVVSGAAAGVYEGEANERVHEIGDIQPNCKAKKVATPFGTLFAGGYGNIVFADGSCRRVNDTGGYGGANKGDSWLGPYPGNPQATTETSRNTPGYLFDDTAYDEVRDEMYLGRLQTRLTAGGGSAE
jgi:prepilin-type processing-associated H-X9-DG protein